MLTLAKPIQTRPLRARAVVIGSGFGGLAAAIRLGARGYQVTIVEKLGAPGSGALTCAGLILAMASICMERISNIRRLNSTPWLIFPPSAAVF